MPERKTAIVTDSACDLPDEILNQYNITFVPLRLVFKGGEKRDRAEINPEEVYAIMPTDLPKTSLPLPEDVTGVYDRLAEQGYTDIIHICISSGLSGTFNMIRMLAEEYTALRVHPVDTKSLSMQEGLIVLNCARMLEKTQDPEAVIAYAQTLRERSAGMFVIRTLEYLRKGGRIGMVEGVLGTVLQLKPVIYVNDEGVYETLAKARGHANALDALCHEIVARFNKAKVQLAIVHGSVPAEGEKLLARLKGLLNVEESFMLPVSPVLGVHTGPGLLGVIACQV